MRQADSFRIGEARRMACSSCPRLLPAHRQRWRFGGYGHAFGYLERALRPVGSISFAAQSQRSGEPAKARQPTALDSVRRFGYRRRMLDAPARPLGVDADRHLRRALWRSRRGMLELDILLVSFARQRYPELAPADQDAYQELLIVDDWQIWDWLQGREQAAAPFRRIVRLIVAFNAANEAR